MQLIIFTWRAAFGGQRRYLSVSRTHDLEPTTPLCLCHGVFTDRFILGFHPRDETAMLVYKTIENGSTKSNETHHCTVQDRSLTMVWICLFLFTLLIKLKIFNNFQQFLHKSWLLKNSGIKYGLCPCFKIKSMSKRFISSQLNDLARRYLVVSTYPLP